MAARIRFALLSLVAVFGLFFLLSGKAKADDKKGTCDVCAAVKDVCESMRCAKCEKADKQCDHCAKAAKEHEAKYACKDCVSKKEMCAACKKFLDDAKGDKVAAAKKLMESKTFCCKKCEKAGEEKAAACDKCKEMREKIEKTEVKK